MVVATLGVVLLLAAAPSAQEPPSFDLRFQAARVTLQEFQDVVSGWERDASIAIVLVVLLAVLGGVTMVLQGVKTSWSKAATVAAGALVSTMTVLNTAIFEADYKTLNRRSEEGHRLIRSANEWLDARAQVQTDADRELILQEIQKRVVSLAELSSSGRTNASASMLPSLTPVVFAEAASCGCLKAPTSDKRFQYFCGTSTGKALAEARRLASDAAVRQAVQYLQSAGGQSKSVASADALAAYVRNAATELDSCASRGAAGFAVSVMLRLPVSLAGMQAQQAFAGYTVPASALRLTLHKIHVVQDGSASPTAWTFEVFADGKTVLALPRREYTDARDSSDVAPTNAGTVAVGNVQVPSGGTVHIEVRGRRTADGAPDAIGSQILDSRGGSVAIEVKNPTSDRKGSFIFFFSASPR
jgi:hypothetical protein